MTNEATTATTDELARVLTGALEQAAQLSDALERECRALTSIDADALTVASQHKAQALATLESFEQARVALCTANGFAGDDVGMQALLARHDPSGELRARYRTLIEALTKCRRANSENGTLVASQRRLVLEALNVLRGGPAQGLYGPHGVDGPSVGGQTLAEA